MDNQGDSVALQTPANGFKVRENQPPPKKYVPVNMINALKKLFGLPGNNETGPSTLSGNRSFHSIVHGGSESETRGQLVQKMMRDTLHKSGISPRWIECQIQVTSGRTRGPGINVRLVVKHWDSRLMQYTFAFQKALLTAIVQFDPKAAIWLHGISWQLEVASTCPHTTMPGKNYWLEAPQTDMHAKVVKQPAVEAAPAVNAAPVAALVKVQPAAFKPVAPAKPAPPLFEMEKPIPENKVTADLERLFAIRDNELALQAANSLIPPGYEKTEPAPL